MAPNGLTYVPLFASVAEAAELVEAIDRQPWMDTLARRTQHYGWRYDYKQRRVEKGSYLGPLPAWLASLAEHVASLGFARPDQAIVNEYTPGQGIAAHVDCQPCFGPAVQMLSLLSDVEMDFRLPSGDEQYRMLLQDRSLLILTDDARNRWSHEIKRRRSDPAFRNARRRRISITMRTVIVS